MAAGAAVACLPRRAAALRSRARADETDLAALAARAIDAARSAGAAYADVRLTQTREQRFLGYSLVEETDRTGAGVRVLVNGYWGFLSSAVWTADEMARLARGAVAQAKANGQGATRVVALGTVPVVANGEWTMPVKYDPFDISTEEKADFIHDVSDEVVAQMNGRFPDAQMEFRRQRKVFASSAGSVWTQTTYLTGAEFNVGYPNDFARRLPPGQAGIDFLTPAGRGWEYILDSGLVERLPALFDEAEQSRYLVPVEVDRYDTVFSARAMAALIDNTLGAATELDRAMGYEANAGGTSYLDAPLEMLGTYNVGTPKISVTANRSLAGGAATVQWDDEGVAPGDFTIVKDGVLVDFQTTREQTAWISGYYDKTGKPLASHGCAGAESALRVTMQHAPNLQLMPSASETSFAQMVAETKKGVAVMSMSASMDQQQLNGVGYAVLRKIVNGALGPYIMNGGVQFRAPELFKNLVAVGGASESRWFGMARGKGQPLQSTTHSVGAVPARIANVDIIDITHRA